MIHDFQDFLPISIYSLIITNCTNFGFSFNELNVLLSLPSLAIKAVFCQEKNGFEYGPAHKNTIFGNISFELNKMQYMRVFR